MATTITDGGAYLLVNDGVKKKYIVKPFDVDIIGTTHIEISDTLGDKVKIAYADITVPASANIEALKDTLSSYLNVPMSGVASEATLLLVKAVLDAIEANTAAISIDADSVNLNTDTLEAKLGDLTEAAPGSDTGSSGLNGRLQRVAQHLTTLIAKDFATQTTVAAILAKIIAAPATEAKQDTIITALTSILTELGDKLDGSAFAAEDFASENTLSAINAKLAALGQAAMAASMPVVIASNQTSVPVTEASAAAIAASASVLDDWDESDRAKVNPVVGSAGLAGGAGGSGSGPCLIAAELWGETPKTMQLRLWLVSFVEPTRWGFLVRFYRRNGELLAKMVREIPAVGYVARKMFDRMWLRCQEQLKGLTIVSVLPK